MAIGLRLQQPALSLQHCHPATLTWPRTRLAAGVVACCRFGASPGTHATLACLVYGTSYQLKLWESDREICQVFAGILVKTYSYNCSDDSLLQLALYIQYRSFLWESVVYTGMLVVFWSSLIAGVFTKNTRIFHFIYTSMLYYWFILLNPVILYLFSKQLSHDSRGLLFHWRYLHIHYKKFTVTQFLNVCRPLFNNIKGTFNELINVQLNCTSAEVI